MKRLPTIPPAIRYTVENGAPGFYEFIREHDDWSRISAWDDLSEAERTTLSYMFAFGITLGLKMAEEVNKLRASEGLPQ